jgi:hypothetical protein
MDINHQSCPPFYKLSNDSNKIMGLHSTINKNKVMLVELCVGNFLLNCFSKIAKKTRVNQSRSEITFFFTILTLLAMCGMTFIILKKKTMSIMSIYPHSILGIGSTLE